MGTDIHGIWQRKEGDLWKDIPSDYNQNRHYLLFAWLGNVRNGFGFAGIPTHTPIKPLTANRGLPDDFEISGDVHTIKSPEIRPLESREYYEPKDLEFWMGDHSFSWASADEILSANFPTIKQYGVISIEKYRSWDGKSKPEDYSGDVFGSMVKVAKSPEDIDETTTHVRVTWDQLVEEELKYFLDEVRRLKELYGEVRFVFGFDS